MWYLEEMDSNSRVYSDIFAQLTRCIKQVDAVWSEIDECCHASLRRAYELCFIVQDGDEYTVVSSSNKESPKNQESYALSKSRPQIDMNISVPAKKPRLSLHSKKCIHSPHNRKQEVPYQKTTTLTPNSEVQRKRGMTGNAPADPLPDDQQVLEVLENNAAVVSHESDETLKVVAPKLSPHEPSESHERPETSSDKLDRTMDRPDVCTLYSSGKKSVTISFGDSSPPTHSQSNSVVTTLVSDSLPPLKTKSTSLGISHPHPFAEMRPFASVERLGGVSRLQTLGTSISNTASKPSSKLQCITEKVNQQTSQLNTSHSGNPPTRNDERSRSVLAAREQMLAEKRRLYESRRQESEARLRAFYEAKQQEREALKRANEQRRLAVKSKAEKIAVMQRIAAENKQQTVVARAKIELEKQKQASVTAKPILSRLAGKENIPTSQSRPAAVKLLNTTVSHHTATEKSFTHTPGDVLKPVPLNKPNVAPAPLSVAPTPVSHPPSTVTTNMIVKLSKVPPPTATNDQVGQLLSPNPDKTFDMSQLNSESESDDEKPCPKPPIWSRKGNLELLPSFKDIRSGVLKFPPHFIIAAHVPFYLSDVFAGFPYHTRARTSSGRW